MKRPLMIVVVMLLCLTVLSCNKTEESFTNPILAGFYPDPSICRVGGDYYLVVSSFAYFPGIPVFHSTDLVNWKQIGAVLDRPEQMDARGLGVSRGIFAPSIRYHNGLFYVTCTLVDKGGNFVATATNPAGPWSSPVWIPEINGIDPSPYFDDDGKAYIIYNSIPPDDKPLYDGHRTIRMYEFDIKTMKVVGEERLIVNGGVDLSKKPIWIEAPHIFKKDGYYYLICAEGGTADQHSEVVFRSNDVWGPYDPYEKNPILTQRHLDIGRKFPVTTAGHADFVETESGEWWAVFLGCRPYELVTAWGEEYFNTGRETFLAPVRWMDGWPVINPDSGAVQYRYPLPVKAASRKSKIPLSGNFTYRDEFTAEKLSPNWIFLRTPHEPWHSLSERKGSLAIRLRPETAAGDGNPSFVGHRQQHLRGSMSVALDVTPAAEHEKAGLLVFQNEKHFYFLCKSLEGETPVVQLYRSPGNGSDNNQMELIASRTLSTVNGHLSLKVEALGAVYAFSFGERPGEWNLLQDNVDARFLSTRVAGGFVGCVIALYGTSAGNPSHTTAYFDWFEYGGDDEMYR
ncbi:MAG: glycoside hydrolase family 43 protein [Ignavibacteriales bacterium]|nr:glycoside hydrolase family 43 protein [Ignavibacteriales bacterium]